jgi:hypothetical protein
MKKGILLILSLLLFLTNSEDIYAQDSTCSKPLIYLGARFHNTILIQKPRLLMNQLENAFPFSLEADISWHLRKKEIWDYCNCYPRTGFAFQYINFAYPDVMGRGFAMIPFIEPYIRADRKFNVSLRFGLGPIILTKLHDAESNPENIFFSSHLSFISHLNLSLNYRVTDQLSMRLAGNFHHISNAELAQPNLGVNLPTINAGIDYSFQSVYFENRVKDSDHVTNAKKNRFDIIPSIALHTTEHLQDRLHPVYTVLTNYSRMVGRLFGATAGLEFNVYQSDKAKILERNLVDEATGKLYDHKRLAATAGLEWLFGKFIISQQLGYYLYSPFAEYQVYQRYGLSYKASDHIICGANLKTHGGHVDFLDLRVGVYF